MIDKRTLEFILTDQQEEIEARAEETLCRRPEERKIDLKSTQAQAVIGVRRSGKSTLCYQALQSMGVKYAYADVDDERLVNLQAEQLNDVLEILYKIYGDFNYLLQAAIQTKCENLLLLTDRESEEISQDDHSIRVQPVYEWSLGLL